MRSTGRSAPRSPMDDLVPRGNLPDRSVIPAGREFGAGAPRPAPRPPVRKAKGGKIHSSASKRADGIAVKGKTRGKIV